MFKGMFTFKNWVNFQVLAYIAAYCNDSTRNHMIIALPSLPLFLQDSHYSLTQGQRFRTLPELLQYYTLQSHLPRSDFYLGDPYHPDDH